MTAEYDNRDKRKGTAIVSWSYFNDQKQSAISVVIRCVMNLSHE